MFISLCILLAGMIFLVGGADILVRSSTLIAKSFGVSSLVIGLTVVAFGTSAPELFVSLGAALKGSASLAVGNVIGSNIANVLGIIGVSALMKPLVVNPSVIKKEMPLMLFVLLVFYIVCVDFVITRFEGMLLSLGILTYLFLSYKRSGANSSSLEVSDIEQVPNDTPIFKSVVLLVVGLIGMILGSTWVVSSASSIAESFGISELVIGITVVAIGTSLPELATTILASISKESDLAVGNALGSNVFNVLAVLGLTALVLPITVAPIAVSQDLPFMLLVCVLTYVPMLIYKKLTRFHGLIMVVTYAAYCYYLLVRTNTAI